MMKTKTIAALFGTLIIAAGCVHTVDDRTAVAWPVGKDKLEGRYERPVSQVYDASVTVMKRLGTVAREGIISPGANEVKTVVGKINGQRVWVRVEPVDQRVTSVKVQVRTSGGGTDIVLTHEIEKQIALELSH
jgi:virulence-associated protein VapD